ncbi:aminoglycoside phosphotransferase family protein [Rhodoferax mekongensis]|uniref:aminoglycoside phosphotransferase family protein n=1 Tax=Rhodoferax mekongensis TaxID=3068341 RepID=UPI0028BEDD84|nr:phosphotransferase [Rhodoferax sp. TBRC 17199]MDT7513677.1 phosphotransferase [Rhodoferax sp. TBRC 17199]
MTPSPHTVSSATPPSPTASAAPALQAIVWTDTAREQRFHTWFKSLQSGFSLEPATLGLASADASFRRYFRVQSDRGSLVIMDAPPDKENCKPFVDIAALLNHAGLRAPKILAWDEADGFMLLTDLGTRTMMQTIDPAKPPLDLYLHAVDTLVQWQLASAPGVLPPYDEALLRRELELFPEWYIARHRNFTLDAPMRKTLDDTFALLIQNNLSWPSVYVHRDFMPRNLMVPDLAEIPSKADPRYLGVLDFQDAVYGPITYDIASLMRDAFLTWEEDFCLDVTIRYWEKARKAGLPVGEDFGEFYRGVEWMGLQRHLKIAGIFARLTLRDGKPKYLADTPRFIDYIRSTCSRYIQLKPLLRLVEKVEGIEVPNVFAFGRS